MAPATEGKRAEGGGRGWGREVEEGQEPGGGEGGGRGGATPTNQPTNPSISGERRSLYDGERGGKGIWKGGGGWFCMLMHACMHSRACASLCERYVFVWALREDDVWEMEEMEEWSKKGAIE